ncbi:hypothetical protein BJF78_01975 [Pseudonocardia sp. CNS-139]|nr:hypothetical protein BJF78_01975 [Pseudonocardia sp. CNS-139]
MLPPYALPPARPFMVFLPTIVAPAASTRAATVASKSGTKPSSAYVPKVQGMPATAVWSLKLTVLPASRPSEAPLISHFHIHAL